MSELPPVSLAPRPADQDLRRPMAGFLGGVVLELDNDGMVVKREVPEPSPNLTRWRGRIARWWKEVKSRTFLFSPLSQIGLDTD